MNREPHTTLGQMRQILRIMLSLLYMNMNLAPKTKRNASNGREQMSLSGRKQRT